MYLYKKFIMKSLIILTVGSSTSMADMLDYYMMGVLPSLAATASKSSVGLKKTGQTNSYTPYDDGHYQTGVTPHYTRNDATEVVTDHITGLEWADDAETASVTKPWLTQTNYDAQNYSDTSGDTATTYCATLTLDGGGWRLPTIKELVGLSDYGRFDPAIDPVFENVTSNDYWSSNTYVYTIYYAWFVNSYGRQDCYGYKNHYHYVRCVRSGE